jgi:hypothetical protein
MGVFALQSRDTFQSVEALHSIEAEQHFVEDDISVQSHLRELSHVLEKTIHSHLSGKLSSDYQLSSGSNPGEFDGGDESQLAVGKEVFEGISQSLVRLLGLPKLLWEKRESASRI